MCSAVYQEVDILPLRAELESRGRLEGPTRVSSEKLERANQRQRERHFAQLVAANFVRPGVLLVDMTYAPGMEPESFEAADANMVRYLRRIKNGDQWYGMEQGKDELPSENFIKPILKYKIATVATNDTTIVFSCRDEGMQDICQALNSFAGQVWESTRMDALKWKAVKAAAITGDSYAYTYDRRPASQAVVQDDTPRLEVELIDRSAVYLADEQEPDIQAQEWIIIV